MKHSRTLYVLLALIALVAAAVLVLNELQRRKIIDSRQEIIEEIQEEMRELQEELGFDKESPAISNLADRLHRASAALEQAKGQWFVLTLQQTERAPIQTHLQGLIDLHTKMLASYRCDLRDYRKLGVEPDSSLMQFTNSQIARLERKLAKLRHNLRVTEKDTRSVHAKLNSLRTLSAESVAHYKGELRTALANGTPADSPRVAHLRARLNDRIRYTSQIDRLSQR